MEIKLINTKKFLKQFQKKLNAQIKKFGRQKFVIDINDIGLDDDDDYIFKDDLREKLENYILEDSQFELIYNWECEKYIAKNGIMEFLLDCKEFLSNFYGGEVPVDYFDIYRLTNFHLKEKSIQILNELLDEYQA